MSQGGAEAVAQARAAAGEATGPAGADVEDPVGDWLEERRYRVARRLEEIKGRLARESETWTDEDK